MTDISSLVRRLDLNQKIAQLHGLSIFDLMDHDPGNDASRTMDGFKLSKVEQLRPHGVGHVSLTWLLNPDFDGFRRDLAQLQEYARAASPFGIGALIHGEGINGFLHAQGFQFPTAWAQAATWDPDLIQGVGATVGDQMRAAGVHLAFAPVLDVARDPRWGRVHETYGEDPELIARIGTAYVRGLHGEENDSGVLAAAKHFLGYGASEGGLNQAASSLGRRAITDVYAEPFRRAIREANLSLVMNSYNEIDGVPSAADRWLFTEFLRGTLGFEGLVVSDYDAIAMLFKTYKTATTPGQAAKQALTAGVDVELPGNETFGSLQEEVTSGRLPEQVLDTAVERVLAMKARLGLIPDIAPRPQLRPARDLRPEQAAALGRRIADKGIVLLANDGILPLKPSGRTAVVGELANEIRINFGAYTAVANAEQPLGVMEIMAGKVPGIDPEKAIFTDLFQTRLPGIETAFEAQARGIHPDAVTIIEAIRQAAPDTDYHPIGSVEQDASPINEDELAARLEGVDTVIAVVGERTGWVGNHTAGEGRTSARVSLPGNQEELILALSKVGKKVVTVIITGRPLLIEPVVEASGATIIAPLLGEHAGPAIADVVFGKTNPSGKLPSTFPRELGQLPLFHGHRYGSGYDHPTGVRHGYTDLVENSPLFAFGHGLSYTTFEAVLEDVSATKEEITVQATVQNTGDIEGDTVLQVYARDEAALIVRPVRQLIEFQRVCLGPGEQRTIKFTVPLTRLAYSISEHQRMLEAGDVTIMIGFASNDLRAEKTIQTGQILAD
ncbi:glycoside hydrolase family 3 C-terminal domain-containing protein [Arthrobacter sp. Sa2CUA1]|uniref:Glycoside hydrolase family 3 C-terminal domain-containing protein n=1 Tax=Arthrobacter gallicola TaxID=2762225 RepID=A0ABR8UWU0_9MICC|nr:glycoside hydrolase family 3 N-terminal domain-containing protein [Arthrobacter gallicola]MBD7996711.1 glycoside hydrolase family 3 C-terminal domain-containing protein [Arthrobacter gallicola]